VDERAGSAELTSEFGKLFQTRHSVVGSLSVCLSV
jgi:hypothetical protein